MKRRMTNLLAAVIGTAFTLAASAQNDGVEKVRQAFQNPPDDSRVMMRWWWFGPAVTHQEISRELHAMKDGGLGGVEIAMVYPLALDDAAAGIKNLPYLSDEHIDALRYANETARSLGLRVDLTLGSGWPYGGPHVPIDQAAGMLRVAKAELPSGQNSVPSPQLDAGEKLETAFITHADGEAIDPKATHQLTLAPDGKILLPPDLADANEVLFFISSRTRQQVKRPSAGAEGFVVDHYDKVAVNAYLNHVGKRLLQGFDDQPPYAIFCDSLEVYGSNWTPTFLDEFKKRRGYDLTPYLPALIADFGPRTAEIRHDWGRTLTDLLDENFIQPLHEFAAKHHTRLRMQAYGGPPATMASYRSIDLPEGEGPQWKILRASRWASSASHVYGRPVASAETWTWVHSPAFAATPLDMKVEADQMFLQGVNQLGGHGWPYTAPSAGRPGWRFYASGALNDSNPWWIVMPDLAGYLQRMSYLLRQGKPANDIAIYLPESDAWADFHDKHVDLIDILRKCIGDDVLARTLEAGYDIDFFDDDELREVGQVDAGSLALGANKYQTVILPNVQGIPLETMKKLDAFARGGGHLIATRRLPEKAPGLAAEDAQSAAVRDLAHRLFEGTGAPALFVADENAGLAAKLASVLRPDVEFSDGKSDLGFVHRKLADADIYFIANASPESHDVNATFRVNMLQVESWNPFAGTTSPAIATKAPDGGATLALSLVPYETRVLVFSHEKSPLLGGPASTAPPASLDLSDNWNVKFKDNLDVVMGKLRSWTDDEATKNYSGLATYERDLDVPSDFLQAGATVQIDLGQAKSLPVRPAANGQRAWIDSPVREAAVVYVNGQRAGAVWHPPYRLDVTRLLRPGKNQLKIVVGNTAINSMAGHPLPDDTALNQHYGERFKPQDMQNLQPAPSGLTGPISLLRTPSTP